MKGVIILFLFSYFALTNQIEEIKDMETEVMKMLQSLPNLDSQISQQFIIGKTEVTLSYGKHGFFCPEISALLDRREEDCMLIGDEMSYIVSTNQKEAIMIKLTTLTLDYDQITFFLYRKTQLAFRPEMKTVQKCSWTWGWKQCKYETQIIKRDFTNEIVKDVEHILDGSTKKVIDKYMYSFIRLLSFVDFEDEGSHSVSASLDDFSK